ncbi:SDR family NAD(P)-dependent oxidoreductase [Streptomyces sp. NPDC050738]|uniref:SDR family NAD(P)-dependent oxidoreductase n=1 Tax=Streptomyces sp. NPDC050738 TaxID=3154744 RepID=UPI00344A81D6
MSPARHLPEGAALPTTVVTGGTDGIGRALADTYLDRGHDVLVIGTNAAKGDALLEAAERRGADEQAHVLTAVRPLCSGVASGTGMRAPSSAVSPATRSDHPSPLCGMHRVAGL